MSRLGLKPRLRLGEPLALGAPLGGAKGSGPAAPNAPVLAFGSESGGLVSLIWDVDNTVAVGDTLNRQAQVTGGNWTVLVDNTSHVITSGEDSSNTIPASLTLPNGTYDIRGDVTSATTGKTSSWSNVVTITISDAVVVNYRIAASGNRRISSAGNYRKAS